MEVSGGADDGCSPNDDPRYLRREKAEADACSNSSYTRNMMNQL